jgi:hypothetical protein
MLFENLIFESVIVEVVAKKNIAANVGAYAVVVIQARHGPTTSNVF